MKWERGHKSQNVEDRRGQRGALGRRPVQIGLVGVLALLGLSALTGQDLLTPFLSGAGGPVASSGGAAVNDEQVQFVGFVLDDAQTTWSRLLGGSYRNATLVVFSDAVQTACGPADSGVGPFYCPGDEKVYIDLGFFRELHTRFGAQGDFAQAYVLAHEIGHHVQNVLGVERRVRSQQRGHPDLENELSVRMELQADCFAGVWANSTAERRLLEQGDVEEAMRAAAAVGDDTLQRRAGARVRPESFTHGSSEQRMRWFQIGMRSGDPNQCDPFGARQL